MEDKKIEGKIGATYFKTEFYERINRCPAVVFVGPKKIPRCDAFGSGGPSVELKRPCTFEEMKKCPVHKFEYTCNKLIEELEEFLERNVNKREE